MFDVDSGAVQYKSDVLIAAKFFLGLNMQIIGHFRSFKEYTKIIQLRI